MSNLKRNTVWSLIEFLATVLIQFFLIRFITQKLGIGALGIWAILLSAAQMARVLDIGASAGTSRFLSQAFSRADFALARKVLGVMFYTTAPFYLLLAAILYPLLESGLTFVVPPEALDQSRQLLPFALASYVGQVISGTYMTALTGIHLGSVKSKIAIFGAVLQALLSILLIERHGLAGIALAQILNYAIATIISLIIIKKNLRAGLIDLFHWDKSVFKDVIKFGFGVQYSSILWSAFEAAIRFIMSRFGGLDQVGRFEIAYKIASQARVLAFYVGQPLYPALIAAGTESGTALRNLYRTANARYSFFAVLAATALIILSPVMSLIMLNRVDPIFLLFSGLAAISATAHIAAIPSELAAMAQGLLRYNITGTSAAFASIILWGITLGTAFGATGVAIAVALSSVAGAAIPMLYNGRKLELPRKPHWREDLQLAPLFRSLLNKGRP